MVPALKKKAPKEERLSTSCGVAIESHRELPRAKPGARETQRGPPFRAPPPPPGQEPPLLLVRVTGLSFHLGNVSRSQTPVSLA